MCLFLCIPTCWHIARYGKYIMKKAREKIKRTKWYIWRESGESDNDDIYRQWQYIYLMTYIYIYIYIVCDNNIYNKWQNKIIMASSSKQQHHLSSKEINNLIINIYIGICINICINDMYIYDYMWYVDICYMIAVCMLHMMTDW